MKRRTKIVSVLLTACISFGMLFGFSACSNDEDTRAVALMMDEAVEKTNPDLFRAVAQSGIRLEDDVKAQLEEEKEKLDAREAEISALLESDRLAREPELINSPMTAQLLKSHGIEPEMKVVRKASWKVVAYKAPKDAK